MTGAVLAAAAAAAWMLRMHAAISATPVVKGSARFVGVWPACLVIRVN